MNQITGTAVTATCELSSELDPGPLQEQLVLLTLSNYWPWKLFLRAYLIECVFECGYVHLSTDVEARGVGRHGTGVAGSCEVLDIGARLNLGSLQEQ